MEFLPADIHQSLNMLVISISTMLGCCGLVYDAGSKNCGQRKFMGHMREGWVRVSSG